MLMPSAKEASGSTSGTATDDAGEQHTVPFTRYTDKMIFVYPFITVLSGGNREAIEAAVVPAIVDYIDKLGLATPLNIPQLYGVAYASDPSIANTYVITDIQVSALGAGTTVRDIIPCAWNEKVTCIRNGGVSIRWN